MTVSKLPPKILAVWIKAIRTTANLSQDALATASSISVRTLQRVEDGASCNVQTRRSLARGLGYDNIDIFDDPTFIDMVMTFMAEMQAEVMSARTPDRPDHVKVAVTKTKSGADLAGLIGTIDASAFHCDEAADAQAQAEAASLFDELRDWGDCWSFMSHRERLEAQQGFDATLASLAALGVHVFQGSRKARLRPGPEGLAPIPFSIGYLVIVPQETELTEISVPKESRAE